MTVSRRCLAGQHDRCSDYACSCPACRVLPDGTGGHPSLLNANAAKAVALATERGLPPAVAHLILEALGVSPCGLDAILPDPPPATLHTEASKVPTAPDPWSSPRAQAASGRRPDNCTTPPGLRDLPPLETGRKAS